MHCTSSHSVNGVAKLHTEILKKEVLKNLYYYILISSIIRLMELHIEDGL